MPASRTLSCFLGCAALLFAATAGATSWQWRDASGRMVYSDRAPPPDVRASQIVRAPLQPDRSGASAKGAASAAGTQSGSGDAAVVNASAAAPGSASVRSSWAERELRSRKKAAERQEAEAEQRRQREHEQANQRACTETRNMLRALESGQRLAVPNARGESEPIDDAERSRRIRDTRGDIERNCSSRPVAVAD